MGDLEFKQRWEFRRNGDDELDSSFEDSISSDGSLIRRQKLLSKSISLDDGDDDGASDIIRHKQKKNENQNPGKRGQIHVEKVKKRKTRKTKKDSPEQVVDLQKGDDHNHAPLDDLKNFMESLLKDLKVTRESLLKWMVDEMQKLVSDMRGKPDHGDKRVKMQKTKKSRKVQDRFERPSNSTRVQNSSKEKNKVQVRDEENDNKQHPNDFGCDMDRSLVKFPTGDSAAGSTDYFNALGDGLASGKFPSSVVLAVEAQKVKGGCMKRSVKGKKTVDLGDHHQVLPEDQADLGDHHQVLPEDQAGQGQAIRTAGSSSTNVENPASSVIQNFLSNPFGQPPSSLYSMLPTFLTEPIVANHGSDASLCNYVQPRVSETKSSMNSEPSSIQGPFPSMSPEESIRRFALMGSRNMDCINQKNSPTSGIGTGFPFPIHQGFDFGLGIPNPRQIYQQNLSQETSKPLAGLKMNNAGATKVSGGGYNLSEHIAANNHHSHPTYKSDARLMSYQIQNMKDGHLFRQQ